MQHTNSSYSGSAFRKTDDYDDEAYEMVQEPYEGEKYPSVDDISPNVVNESLSKKKEPKSPSFNMQDAYQFNQASPQINQQKTIPQSIQQKHHTQGETQDFVKQLMNKIKKQAEQLMQLENYKMMCERRIKELVPIHPLPVDPSHFGNTELMNRQFLEFQKLLRAKDEEIQQLQNELRSFSQRKSPSSSIDYKEAQYSSPSKFPGEEMSGNYNILYNKYKALLAEKQHLEESLRNETFANEEQRTYIEILKQMLDDRFDRLALSQWITGLPTKDKIDTLMEMKHMSEQLRGSAREIDGYKERFRELEIDIHRLREDTIKLNEKNEKLIEENVRINEQYIKINQTVKAYETEVKKIEEEKSNLIDYADEKDKKAEALSREFTSLLQKHEKLAEERDNILNEYEKMNEELNGLREQLRRIDAENHKLRAEEYQSGSKLAHSEHEKQLLHEQLQDTIETYKTNMEKLKHEQMDLMRERDRQIEKLKRERENLETELRTYKEMYHEKDQDLRERLFSIQKEYENNLEKLENKLRIYEKNELTLKGMVDKNSSEAVQSMNRLGILQEQKKLLESDLAEYRKINEDLTSLNDELRKRVEKLEKAKVEAEEKVLNLTREINKSKEESMSFQKKFNDINEYSSTLEKRLMDREQELASFDGALNESKEKMEKDKQTRLEELKKIYDENNTLRQENRTLKENYNKSLTSINLKEEEISILRNHIEKKNQHNQSLIEENRTMRQKMEDLGAVRDQLEFLRSEKEKNFKEIREYEEILDNKNSTLRNTMTKLEVTEQELFVLTNNLKSAQQEKEDYLIENSKLKRRLIDLEEDERILRASCDEKDEKLGRLLRENEKMQRQLLDLTKEMEEIVQNNQMVQEEKEIMKIDDDRFRNCIDKSLELSKETLRHLKEFFETYNNILQTSPDSQIFFTKSFKELIQTFDYLRFSKEDESVLPQFLDYLYGSLIVVFEEIENLSRRLIDAKQDLQISQQRVSTLEKKCMNLNSEEANARQREMEARKELDLIREERLFANKDGKSITALVDARLQKENEELKKEISKLQNEIENIKDITHDKGQGITFRRKDSFINEEPRNIQDKYQVVVKEKKSLEEIIEKLCLLFANPDLKRLLSDILKVQMEIDTAEREKVSLESLLSEMETDFKLIVRKGGSPSKGGEKRAQIEQKRNDLNNVISQIAILKKRKGILFEELKSFEVMEKRRYEIGMETEKSLVEAKKELNELKLQKHGLENINVTLKETVKSISQEKQILDYENMKLRYRDEQENDRNYTNYSPMNYERSHSQPKEESHDYMRGREGIRKDSGNYTSQDTAADYSSKLADGSYTERHPSRRLGEPSGSYYSDKKTFAKQNEQEPYSQIKLKDRLNQAKTILSTIKKSHETNEY